MFVDTHSLQVPGIHNGRGPWPTFGRRPPPPPGLPAGFKMELPPAARGRARASGSPRDRGQTIADYRNRLRAVNRRTATPRDRETAIHEAGHIVAAVRSGLRVRGASRIPDGLTLGYSLIVGFRDAAPRLQFIVSLAGPMAAAKVREGDPYRYTLVGSDREFVQNAAGGTSWYYDLPAFRDAERAAERLLQANWCAVEVIGLMLLGDREIDEAAITRALARN